MDTDGGIRNEKNRGYEKVGEIYSKQQWRIQGGFLVARKHPPDHDFLNQGCDIVTGTDPNRPLTFVTFRNPPSDQLWIRH